MDAEWDALVDACDLPLLADLWALTRLIEQLCRAPGRPTLERAKAVYPKLAAAMMRRLSAEVANKPGGAHDRL